MPRRCATICPGPRRGFDTSAAPLWLVRAWSRSLHCGSLARAILRRDPSPHLKVMEKLSARQLFDAVGDRLALRWAAGMRGENRLLEPGGTLSRRPSLVGYLN